MRYRMRSSIAGSAALGLVLLAMANVGIGKVRDTRDYSPFPNPDAGYVTDLAGLLPDEQEQQIEQWLLRTEDDRGVEIIVVTLDSIADYPGTPNRSIEEFARGLFDAYGIGNLPDNDGVLLLVARRDRKVRIELGAGYGHRRDRDAQRIVQKKILPSFRKDRYAQGISRGVKALIREFGGVMLLPGWLPWAFVGIAAALVPLAISLFKNGKRGWGWVVVGLIIVLLLAVFFLIRRTVGYLHDHDAGGFGSGGLGGFGGGFSGGGGATGSW